MMPLKRMLNEEDRLVAEDGRYGPSSYVQQSTFENPFCSFNLSQLQRSHSNTWDTDFSGATLHDGSINDLGFQSCNMPGNGLDFEPDNVINNTFRSQIQQDNHSFKGFPQPQMQQDSRLLLSLPQPQFQQGAQSFHNTSQPEFQQDVQSLYNVDQAQLQVNIPPFHNISHRPASLNESSSNSMATPPISAPDESTSHSASQLDPDTGVSTYDVTSVPSTNEASQTFELPPICYGMIYRSAVRLAGDMLKTDHKLRAAPTLHGFAKFQVQQEKGQLVVKFPDGDIFGFANEGLRHTFHGTMGKFCLRLEAVVNVPNVQDNLRTLKKAGDAVVRVNINVFGQRKNAAAVGKRLSDGKIWLQKPDQVDRGTEIENPHFLKLEGFDHGQELHEQADIELAQSTEEMDKDAFKKTIEDVFEQLTRSKQLKRIEKDRRVKTRLLPHQEEGLDFMEQREFGPVQEEYRLWKKIKQGETDLYRHSMTGHTSRIPYEETGGGVLADEMGMGKSLSILSLIAKTTERADEWLHGSQDDGNETFEKLKSRSRATLIIVSAAVLISEWKNEIKIHLDESITFCTYHGIKRKSLRNELRETDIVFTTYNTLVREYQDKQKRKRNNSLLHELEFFRVVLDEAHIIRRKGTLFNRAVSELNAKSRWCLTGTPIQNKLEDMGALFAFIRARPFNNVAMFRRFIVKPFGMSKKERSIAIERFVALIDSLCVRRTRDTLELPETQVIRKELDFSEVERNQYSKAVRDMERTLKEQVNTSNKMYDFGMFHIHLQLRILCNHGTFQDPMAWREGTFLDTNSFTDAREFAIDAMAADGDLMCSHCRQVMPPLSSTNIYRTYEDQCRHVICDLCLGIDSEEWEGSNKETKCPICARTELLRGFKGSRGARRIPNDLYFRETGYSTKMFCLVNDLRENLSSQKSIVFSCWTRTLELISRHLRAANIRFERIDGSIPPKDREKILNDFATRTDLPVLIMTTGTGAYGLNLTAANRIFIFEPQWNPAVENQAISRAIRLNQKHSVQVTRYVMKDTVEQDMHTQQTGKIAIAALLDQNAMSTTGQAVCEIVDEDMTDVL